MKFAFGARNIRIATRYIAGTTRGELTGYGNPCNPFERLNHFKD